MIGTGSFPYELSLSAPAGWCCRAEAAADATPPPRIGDFWRGAGLRVWMRWCNPLCNSAHDLSVSLVPFMHLCYDFSKFRLITAPLPCAFWQVATGSLGT